MIPRYYKRILSVCLALILMLSVVPALSLTAEASSVAQQVVYNLGYSDVTIGYETDTAAHVHWDANGDYEIQLEDGAFFPYEIRFIVDGGEPQVKTFDKNDASMTIGGHGITVHSEPLDEGEDPVLTKLGFNLNGTYVPAKVPNKTFSNPRGEFSTHSLLPYPTTYLEVDIEGFTQQQLDNVTIEYEISGGAPGDRLVMWDVDEEDGYNLYDDYAIVNDDTVIWLWHNRSMELLVGPPEALNPNRTRYSVSFKGTPDTVAYLDYSLYAVDDDGSWTDVVRTHSSFWRWDEDDNRINVFRAYIDPDYDVNGTYRLLVGFSSNDGTLSLSSAYLGHYASKQAALDDGAEEITAAISGSMPDGGYEASFANGVAFTVFDDTGNIYYCSVEAREYEVTTPGPSTGTNLNVYDVLRESEADGYISGNRYNTVKLYGDDTYRNEYNWQTLLVLDDDFDPTSVVLDYSANSKATVAAHGERQISRETAVDFTENPVVYTVTSEAGTVRNHFVSIVGSTPGAELFVEGPDTREVFLDGEADYRHDVYIANTGRDDALTGIRVELIDAVNVRVDDYWTAGNSATNSSLAPFESTSSSRMWNIAKIRLAPDGVGRVSGTLRISSDNGGSRDIELIGWAGDADIITTELKDSYQYVPYSFTIQTNTHRYNDVTLSLIDGVLPQGMEFFPNGEIYGAPLEQGSFPITVLARFESADPVTADFVLEVLAPTDENLKAANDYDILISVPRTVRAIAPQTFSIDAEYGDFVDFWINGVRLGRDTDYLVDEGSTVITIMDQTVSGLGNGSTNTISAEFDQDGEQKVSSQNFDIDLGAGTGSGTAGGSSGGSSGSSGSGNGSSKIDAQSAAALLGSNLAKNADGYYMFDLDGSGAAMELRINIDFSQFQDLSMDGVLMARGTEYMAKSGSTILTIPASSLEKLSEGAHTVKARFTNQTVQIPFTLRKYDHESISQPNNPAMGGDDLDDYRAAPETSLAIAHGEAQAPAAVDNSPAATAEGTATARVSIPAATPAAQETAAGPQKNYPAAAVPAAAVILLVGAAASYIGIRRKLGR